MLSVTILKLRLRYIRFMVTNSSSSATQGPHQLAQRLTTRRFFPSFLTSLATPASSIDSSDTGSLSHFASDSTADSRLSDHLVEQPKTRVVSTGTDLPASKASTALRASCDLTVLTSESSNRPLYRSFRSASKM